jgi:hypothetical protein
MEENDLYKIREFDGIDGIDHIIAEFNDPTKAKEIFHNLKRGGGFEGRTPNFFGKVDYSVDY